jgi:hypothetical protein
VFSEKGQYFALQQTIIRELLQREILMGMSTLKDFIRKHEKKGKVLAWRDPFIKNQMRHRDGISPKYFHSAKGFGLEDLVADVVDWHLQSGTDLEKLLGFPFERCEILRLDYEGKTDADLLLVEINEEKQKPCVLIFNIKTHPKLLLSEDSICKFQELCQQLENFVVFLALMVSDLYDQDSNLIFAKWNGIKGCTLLNKIYSLNDFLEIAPTIRVKRNGVLSVDRPLEKNLIKQKFDTLFMDVVVQGRFRVGKTHLLKEMADENDGWIYKELLYV